MHNRPNQRVLLFVLWFSCFLTTATAQFAEKEVNLTDSLLTKYLDEIIIAANKTPEYRLNVALQVRVINPTFLKDMNVPTTADLLQNSGSVYIQRSQQGGGSPVLRGFEASRVLLMVDGVRMNNAIFRAGHLQNVITIDNNILDHVEILFGPASTVYGSDALGGVINFYTRDVGLSSTKKMIPTSHALFRYGSVNNEKTAHFDLNFANKNFGSLTSITASDFGDLKMGKNQNPALGKEFGLRNHYIVRSPDNSYDILKPNSDKHLQRFSGYSQFDLLEKFLFKPNDRFQHLLNLQFSTSTDIPRYDRLTDTKDGIDLKFSQWYYGPQKRFLLAYQFQMTSLGNIADQLTAMLSFQKINESRHNRNFNSNLLNHQNEEIKVVGFTVDLKKIIAKHEIRYGFDSQFNWVQSLAKQENIVTKATTSLGTRYPDGSNVLHYWALYVSHTWHVKNHLTISDGVRGGRSFLKSTFIDKTFFPFPFNDIIQNSNYISGNIGLIYNPPSWKFSVTGNTGVRIPNIDDLTKVFESTSGTSTNPNGILIGPNSNLKPEKTINVDFNITKVFSNALYVEGVFFITKFFDAIVTLPTVFQGSTTVNYNGYLATVLSSQNVNQGYLYGYTLGGRWVFLNTFALSASYNYTFGRIQNQGDKNMPLDHIAPSFGKISLQYIKKKIRLDLFSVFNGWKKLEDYNQNGEDNLVYATEKGMPSWITHNARASYKFNNYLTIQAGIDNMLDLQYRTFASGINSPGRNISITMRANF